MRVDEIRARTGLRPLKFPAGETPHATIEPNRTCNIRCRLCYTLDRASVKSLGEVKMEIDLASQKRNLETITLLGGEPTLHPDLVEIVSHVKAKKLVCQLLTNGIKFLQDRDDLLLDSLIAAGVDRILCHIDIGQEHVHKNIEETCDTLFSKLENKRVHFSLSMTIYDDNKGTIPVIIKRYSRYRFFDGVLAILARDPKGQASAVRKCEMTDEYTIIKAQLGIEPTAYIPSNLDDSRVNWLVYHYYINAQTGKASRIPPILDRAFRRIYRLRNGRHFFAMSPNPTWGALDFLTTGVASIMTESGHVASPFALLKDSSRGSSIRLQYIIIQNPPEVDRERNQIQFCFHCPDATIRNGRLTPVCIADQLSPLNGGVVSDAIPGDLRQTVYEHLEGPGVATGRNGGSN